MIYGSLCSGIEAATVAWEPLGWTAAWFSEINEFCNAVLAAHYPTIPNLRDMTEIFDKDEFQPPVDLIVGGTPCQSFSLSGARGGLADDRGNLALEFIKILSVKQPRWFIWENVPGVLSLNQGRDFSIIRQKLREAGYGYACGILDARDFGLQQNRPRVFVVGYLGDWRPPAEVLRERPARYYDNKGKSNGARRIPTLTLRNAGNGNARGVAIVETVMQKSEQTGSNGTTTQWQIRACTPGEEECRQGFPRGYTQIAWNGGSLAECPDQLRYEAIGNSMAIPVMRWLGERIQIVDQIPLKELQMRYSEIQKQQVRELLAAGKSPKDVVQQTKVGISTVQAIRSKTTQRKNKSILPPIDPLIQSLIEAEIARTTQIYNEKITELKTKLSQYSGGTH